MLKKDRIKLILWLSLALLIFGGLIQSLFKSTSDMPETTTDTLALKLEQLADTKYEGRKNGTAGHELFKLDLLEKMNTLTLDAVYTEAFSYSGILYDQTPKFSVAHKETPLTFALGKDYSITYSPITGPIDYQGDLIFLERSYFSLDPKLLEGKIVVSTFNRLTDEVIEYAIENKVRGLLIMEESLWLGANAYQADFKFDPSYGAHVSDQLFLGRITSDVYFKLRNLAKENLFEGFKYDPKKPNDPLSGIISQATLSVKDQYPISTGTNLIGKIQGKSDDFVCFYTAYDGIGVHQDKLYSGVISQLTGVEAILEMMTFASHKTKMPDQTIYFAFVDAESTGNQGILSLIQSLPANGEYINISKLGYAGESTLLLGSRNSQNNQATAESDILLSRYLQYFEAQNLPVDFTAISPNDSAFKLFDEQVPSILITQIGNPRAVDVLGTPEETLQTVDIAALNSGIHGLIALVNQAYYQAIDYTFIPFPIRVAVIGLYLLVVVMLIIRGVFIKNPERKWFGLEIYLSTPYMLLSKILKATIPTLIMLIIMLFILLIPSYITKTDYMGGYSNYVFHLHFQRVVFFITQLFSEPQSMIPASLKTSLFIGLINSTKLFVSTIMISLIIGVFLGMSLAIKPKKAFTLLQLILYSIPDVLLSLLGLYLIIWLVKHKMLGPFTPEQLRLTLIPMIVMSVVPAIYISRMVQIHCIELFNQQFIYGALSRGIPFGKVVMTHILPMLLSTLFSTMSSILRLILVNLLIVEFLYSSVGIGAYLIINRFDPTYVLLISICLGAMYLIANTFFRLLGLWLNPVQRRSL